MCNKGMKPVTVADPKKEEKKNAAPKAVVAAAAPVKAEKKKDNVESLPPTSWVLYDFKTFFVNH